MKRSASIFAVVVAVLLMGCQDNSITDPTTAAGSRGLQLSKTQPATFLALDAVLHEPGNVHGALVQVNGSATYLATVIAMDPIPPNPQYAVRLNMDVSAEIRPSTAPPSWPAWLVSGISEDWIPLPENSSAFVTKSYRLEGRNDGMLLNVKFEVSLTGIELNNLWLELPRIQREEDVN